MRSAPGRSNTQGGVALRGVLLRHRRRRLAWRGEQVAVDGQAGGRAAQRVLTLWLKMSLLLEAEVMVVRVGLVWAVRGQVAGQTSTAAAPVHAPARARALLVAGARGPHPLLHTRKGELAQLV